jgi:hypothetical protein
VGSTYKGNFAADFYRLFGELRSPTIGKQYACDRRKSFIKQDCWDNVAPDDEGMLPYNSGKGGRASDGCKLDGDQTGLIPSTARAQPGWQVWRIMR